MKVLSGHGASHSELSKAGKESDTKACAAQACSQVAPVCGHCIKDQQSCLVMFTYESSPVTLVEGDLPIAIV